LIGDFGVSPEREIIKEKKNIFLGDWTLQGYVHYAGSLMYRQKLNIVKNPEERIYLTIEDFSASVIRVIINQKEAGFIPWKGYKLEITDFLLEGENIIEFEVVGSLRNMLGPLHFRRRKINFVSAENFRPEKENYTKDYVLYPYGIFSPPKLEIHI
ncbi:MAG: hypothetical protein ACK4SU_05060, partial [Dictyoglomus sp.]